MTDHLDRRAQREAAREAARLARQEREHAVWEARRARRASVEEGNRQAGREEARRTGVAGRTHPIVVHCMEGMGDTIFQRPLIRQLIAENPGTPVYVASSWPELLEDIPHAGFVYPARTTLRTQRKNSARQDRTRWVKPPSPHKHCRPRYMLASAKIDRQTIMAELARSMNLRADAPLTLDLPDFGPSPVAGRYALVRPVTHRREWLNSARSPRPEYVVRAAELLRAAGYQIVSVADVDGSLEWLEEPAPVADVRFHHGELGIRELMALTQHAGVVVGGVGWIMPAGVAAKVPTVIIGGGNGEHNAPWIITDPRMDLSRYRHLLPDPYCECARREHACTKEIPDFDAQFAQALAEVTAPMEAAA